ncbi:hypothetical protein ACH44C_18690 [Streptomyces purpureus]|uniref:hypothetical protein n=1 Tax=Streptomyces purpureus TaxID=1951 RepID=UPI003787B4C0
MTNGGNTRAGWGMALVLAVAAGISGCATGDTPPPPSAAPPPAASPSTAASPSPATSPSASPQRAADPDEVLVSVNVSGGFAGVSNELRVHGDGRWTVRTGKGQDRTGRMTGAEVARLRASLEAPAYARVPVRPTGPTVFDGFQYVIAHDHRVVVAADGERPDALRRVFDALPRDARLTST